MAKVRIYLKGLAEPLELDGQGVDKDGRLWDIVVTFKDQKMVYVHKEWRDSRQVLYTIPINNLHYIDWGNWSDA